MSAVIDITKIIELKNTLKEKFGVEIHVHDACGGQYFSVDNITPDAKEYIHYFFQTHKYIVIFNNETEFYLEDMRIC